MSKVIDPLRDIWFVYVAHVRGCGHCYGKRLTTEDHCPLGRKLLRQYWSIIWPETG